MDIYESVEHGFADNDGVRIHYATMGEGPLMVMTHGFPDFWYSWRDQMAALADRFQVVAPDLRGFNESGKPKGVENYAMDLLVSDIEAVVRHCGREEAVIVGHDWGGAISWSFAMTRPAMTERLVILNLPHPSGLSREYRKGGAQYRASEYARNFQKPDSHQALSAERLAGWVKDDGARKRYEEAFARSDFEAMMNIYRANYMRIAEAPEDVTLPKVKCPVLMIHGLEDIALLPEALNDTWKWLERDLTLVTIPGAGHFVQQDASDLVTRSMRMWLDR